jgi:hypothetical protein
MHHSRAKGVLVLAPGHDELDKRVARSIDALGVVFDTVVVVYERHRSCAPQLSSTQNALTENDAGARGGNDAKLVVRYVDSSRFAPFLRRELFFAAARPYLDGIACVYVHDSGLAGLFLSAFAAKRLPQARIIFDYHDWIPWEISYQLSKLLRSDMIVRPLARLALKVLRFFLVRNTRLDGLVGISSGQLDALKTYLGPSLMDVPSLVVPNTKSYQPEVFEYKSNRGLCLVRTGYVMEGRDISKLLEYSSRFRQSHPEDDLTILLIGRSLSPSLDHYLSSLPFVTCLGTYRDESCIVKNLPNKKCIGMFLGWDDTLDTGINAIASPNKLYTYLSIGLPFVYSSSLANVTTILGNASGFAIDGYDSFERALLELSTNYEVHRKRAIEVKARTEWDEDVRMKMIQFLSTTLTAPGRRSVQV